jgi:hypothetical protein
MQRLVLFALSVLTVAAPCAAQDLTAAQRDVVAALTRCFDGWVQSFVDRSFSTFAKACPQSAEAAFWYTDRDGPVAYGGDTGLWNSVIGSTQTYAWRALQPISVLLDDDLALVFFTVTWSRQPNSGAAVEAASKRMNVFRKKEGVWEMVGGMMTTVE